MSGKECVFRECATDEVNKVHTVEHTVTEMNRLSLIQSGLTLQLNNAKL